MNSTILWFKFQKTKKPISIDVFDNSKTIKQSIITAFDVNPRLSFRVRNSKGNLVPISQHLLPNTPKTAYVVEFFVPLVRESPKAKDEFKEIRMSTAWATKAKIKQYSDRLEKLESIMNQSNNVLHRNISIRMNEVEERLSFVEKRMQEVKSTQWQGIFKKPLLW